MLNNLLKLGLKIGLTPILLILPIISKAIEGDYIFFRQVACDYSHFYSEKGLFSQMIGLGIGGYFANTELDPQFRIFWQDHIRNDFSDQVSTTLNDYSKITRYPVAIPMYVATLWLSNSAFSLNPHSLTGLWANHALRTLLLGAPSQALFTHLLGSNRPPLQHDWHLFKYHRAVSGHAFYGAIPLISGAMQVNDPWLKGTLYTLSTLPGLARINEDKHYLSQVWLGWWLAYSASQAIKESDKVSNKPQNFSMQVLPIKQGIYLSLAKNL